MSLQFNDTTNYKGILQTIERGIYGQDAVGRITDNSTLLKQWTADVNTAWDSYLAIALQASGKWQFDDSNHTDHPFIKTNLVSGTEEYAFTSDENSNLILDIIRVSILPSATATEYVDLEPVDQQSDDYSAIRSEATSTGVPAEYDKTGNVVFLDPQPDYNATNGLKIYINREANYFTSSDTTKAPGCPGNHHRYFALKPMLEYGRFNTLTNFNLIEKEVMALEKQIEYDFGKRQKDERQIMSFRKVNYL